MSKIRILPENLANQIAAGEVVERPASVVKELVENAIDAGAGQIDVQVEGNGTRLLRVIDDGLGMDQDDVLLCLERHATSKIASIDELGAIRSLGFRGEAVPSIASVCRLRITSRQDGAMLGTQVDVRYGRLLKVHEMGCPVGTSFEVTDLFGNVPARKKFLKSARTELAHIEEVVRSYALARHGIGFSCSVDGREILRLPAETDGAGERAARLLLRGEGRFVLVGQPFESVQDGGKDIHVFGYLLPPDSPSSGRFRVFVNGRAVQDRVLFHAVSEGLQNYLMKGRRPAGVLFLRVAPASVDVNVHPTKQEVRFHQPAEIHHVVAEAVRQGMALYQQELRREIFARPVVSAEKPPGARALTPCEYPEEAERVQIHVREPASLFGSGDPARSGEGVDSGQVDADGIFFGPDESVPSVSAQGAQKDAAAAAGPLCKLESALDDEVAGGDASERPSPSGLRYLGQVLNTYLLCANEEGLLAIDQHAAHERLLFESLKKQFARKRIARQSLLFPKVVECSLDEAQILQQHAEEIASLGLDVEDFGGGSYVIKAVPAVLGRSSVEEVLAGIFARFSDSISARGGARAEEILSDMACKAAIKAGQSLTSQEAEALLAEMRRADIFSHCPHGRPVVKSFSASELKKWFYRG